MGGSGDQIAVPPENPVPWKITPGELAIHTSFGPLPQTA